MLKIKQDCPYSNHTVSEKHVGLSASFMVIRSDLLLKTVTAVSWSKTNDSDYTNIII